MSKKEILFIVTVLTVTVAAVSALAALAGTTVARAAPVDRHEAQVARR